LARRVGRIEGRTTARRDGPPLLVLCPDGWSGAVRLAFDGGDPTSRDAAVERCAGVRPGSDTRLVVLSLRPDGPR